MRLPDTITFPLAIILTLAGLATFTYSFWGEIIGITLAIMGVVVASIVALTHGFYSLLRVELALKHNQDPGSVLSMSAISSIGLAVAAILGLTGVLSPMAASALALVSAPIYPANIVGQLVGALAMGPHYQGRHLHANDDYLAD